MKLEKKISKKRWFNILGYDDLLVDFINNQDFPKREKDFMIKWFPRIMDLLLGIGRFFIFFYIFSKTYDRLGDKFIVLVFTFFVVFMFKKTKKV